MVTRFESQQLNVAMGSKAMERDRRGPKAQSPPGLCGMPSVAGRADDLKMGSGEDSGNGSREPKRAEELISAVFSMLK